MTQQDPQTPATPSEQPAADAAPEAAPAPEQASGREEELLTEVSALKDQLLRAVAETENVRRRLEQQAEDRGKYAVAGFAKDMLQVADNLRRALESIPADARENDSMAHKLAEGVELTERVMLSAFERYNIKKVEALGQRFDPHLHQAMMEVEDPNQPSGMVVLEMQAGYVIADRLLRPAMVGVSKGGPKATAENTSGLDTTA
ncbi:MAG TPA: nucleotide exchange factor GrpE [Candidatus Sulfotelmatobacter sp.]|jgi:molecular chaperone GrpE|nr:nucleotide exchange factor GrpE [Candidatus Sulfotelmatobacter sp.]